MAQEWHWLDDAILNLAEHEDLDAGLSHTLNGYPGFAAYMVEFRVGAFDGADYIVCEDADEAERLAVAQVEQDLEEAPEMFNQDWLMGHFTISKTDIRMIAGENANNYVEDLDDERAIEEANMEDSLDPYQQDLDDAEEALLNVDDDDDDELDRLEAARDAAEEALDAASSSLGDDARESIASDYAENMESELSSDPLAYFRATYGWSARDVLEQNIGSLNTAAAAQDAVDTDGVGHFLSGYDGNQIDLDDGSVAFRTN